MTTPTSKPSLAPLADIGRQIVDAGDPSQALTFVADNDHLNAALILGRQINAVIGALLEIDEGLPSIDHWPALLTLTAEHLLLGAQVQFAAEEDAFELTLAGLEATSHQAAAAAIPAQDAGQEPASNLSPNARKLRQAILQKEADVDSLLHLAMTSKLVAAALKELAAAAHPFTD